MTLVAPNLCGYAVDKVVHKMPKRERLWVFPMVLKNKAALKRWRDLVCSSPDRSIAALTVGVVKSGMFYKIQHNIKQWVIVMPPILLVQWERWLSSVRSSRFFLGYWMGLDANAKARQNNPTVGIT